MIFVDIDRVRFNKFDFEKRNFYWNLLDTTSQVPDIVEVVFFQVRNKGEALILRPDGRGSSLGYFMLLFFMYYYEDDENVFFLRITDLFIFYFFLLISIASKSQHQTIPCRIFCKHRQSSWSRISLQGSLCHRSQQTRHKQT